MARQEIEYRVVEKKSYYNESKWDVVRGNEPWNTIDNLAGARRCFEEKIAFMSNKVAKYEVRLEQRTRTIGMLLISYSHWKAMEVRVKFSDLVNPT